MRFSPVFHAVMAATNVFLAINSYKLGHLLDVAMHSIFTVNFFVMFLLTNNEAKNADADE
jgi:hypothetical protein